MVRRLLATVLVAGSVAAPALAQQPIDTMYTRIIREISPTDARWKLTTELVDYLPASATIPTPLAVVGYVPGTEGRLSDSRAIHGYFRTVAEKSPRVQVTSLGATDLGREMIVAAIADEATIGRLEEYKAMARRLADPRGLSAAERERLVREAKPIYYITGSIHSTETGSPDMLMELLYRLAVDESAHIRAIRNNAIVLITPIFEVDGRDHMVDWYNQGKRLYPNGGAPGGLPYWGKYVAHDNNRDGMVVSNLLTKNYLKAFLDWRPTVTHDLHESAPFLYVSTGTGPYNEEFDAITIQEWHTLAYQDVTELTRRGLPGVWTHVFYDGWAPSYQLAIANLHNSIGRFYETYTSRGADCQTVQLGQAQTSRQWYRPNPPVNGIRWCIRSNQNFQQSGVLISLRYVAEQRETFLRNNVTKAERSIDRGRYGPLHAYIVPSGQASPAEAADLVNLMRTQGTEVHVASADFTVRDAGREIAVKAGDWIVRLDQPYSQFPRTILGVQTFRPDDPRPYDDTGWTLDAQRHVTTIAVRDSAILARPMTLLTSPARVEGVITGAGGTLLVRPVGDWRSAAFPWRVPQARVAVAEEAFTVADERFAAGTYILPDSPAAREAIRTSGLKAVATGAVTARQRALRVPRIALAHSWSSTQDEGWVRLSLEHAGVPFTYVADQKFKDPGFFDRFDVVIYPHVGGSLGTLINGRMNDGPPMPWKKTAQTPHLGEVDETDDVRPGMGADGIMALRKFIERGGLLIVEGASVNIPIGMEMTTGVSVVESAELQARGAVFRAQVAVPGSPIMFGYSERQFPLYFRSAPLLQ
ncbi:MAG: M14 family zinc carboxypeptidase, partial [Gemmatimonadota bacterium]|nr:M14 family zinc carboxypeptidase [Gemmatimonadota bacterium]